MSNFSPYTYVGIKGTIIDVFEARSPDRSRWLAMQSGSRVVVTDIQLRNCTNCTALFQFVECGDVKSVGLCGECLHLITDELFASPTQGGNQ